ncbi:hypothetical protein E2C01_053878 [Portunus trituberculatus]|uniref:Uncharacterized protein n=1 Tax=Portunus trituberculatus TaxID=210409 RepID=A0A5B7GHU7_PORTR|nr:hypothetical protein [Portunus trituberculatus]
MTGISKPAVIDGNAVLGYRHNTISQRNSMAQLKTRTEEIIPAELCNIRGNIRVRLRSCPSGEGCGA